MNTQTTLNSAVGASFFGKLIVPVLAVFDLISWSDVQISTVYTALTMVDAALLAYGFKLRRDLSS